MKLPPSPLERSVHDRLVQKAKQSNTDPNNLRLRYANERLLYRLSRSHYADRFILKDAALFAVWSSEAALHRPTRDLDFLGIGSPSPDDLEVVLQDIFRMGEAEGVEPDGVTFLEATLESQARRDEERYPGVQLNFEALVGGVSTRLQVDVGFGDTVTPLALEVVLPVILNFPAPRLRIYPRETVIAEKLENILARGLTNTRLKDYFDICFLAQHYNFAGSTLAEAITATCERRNTPLGEGVPEALDEFCSDEDKQRGWLAFLKKDGLPSELDLPGVGVLLRAFLLPPLDAARARQKLSEEWIHQRREWQSPYTG